MILCLNKEVVCYGDDIVLRYVDVDDEEKIIYISRELYDTCIILTDRYGDCNGVAARVLGEGHEEDIEFFMQCAPQPLQILAPFLNLISADVQLERQFDKMCGYLSMLSRSIDFLNYMKAPIEVKKSVSFTQYDVRRCDSMQQQFVERVKIAEVDETSVTTEFIKTVVSEAVRGVLRDLYIVQPTLPTVEVGNYASKLVQEVQIKEAEEDDVWGELNSMFGEEEESPKEEEKEEEKHQTVAEELQIAEQEANSEKSLIDNIAKLYGGV